MLYKAKLKSVVKRANTLLANSNLTKNDLVKHLSVRPDKVTVTHLGINLPSVELPKTQPEGRYIDTSWGYLYKKKAFDTSTPFILYVGGAEASAFR